MLVTGQPQDLMELALQVPDLTITDQRVSEIRSNKHQETKVSRR